MARKPDQLSHMLKEIVLRMLIGGSLVSAFSVIGDIFTPKRFAGLFGAAPSVALATLALTAHESGKLYAATEARSMIAGALAFSVYSYCVYLGMRRSKLHALALTSVLLIVWTGLAFGVWSIWLR